MMPPGFSKADKEEEGVLHNFTRILLAIRKKRKRRTIIQQEPVIYLSKFRHGRWEWVSSIRLQAYL
jgi:hypothetical protein